MTLFARRVAHLTETHRELVEDADGVATAVYTVTGELFFASSNDLYTQFEYADDPDQVVIDLTASHVWDASTVASLDAITTKYERKGKTVADHRPQRGQRRPPRPADRPALVALTVDFRCGSSTTAASNWLCAAEEGDGERWLGMARRTLNVCQRTRAPASCRGPHPKSNQRVRALLPRCRSSDWATRADLRERRFPHAGAAVGPPAAESALATKAVTAQCVFVALEYEDRMESGRVYGPA